MMKGIEAGIFSLVLSVTICTADDTSYFSEPRPQQTESFEARKEQAQAKNEKPLFGRDQNEFYFDRYDDGRSDYKRHIYGEESDYIYWKEGEAQRRPRSQSDNDGRSTGNVRRVRGEVQEVTPVDLQNRDGRRESHHLARLRLEDTGTMLVDLGPNRSISDFDLEPGDVVAIQGRNGKIDNKTVLFADRISVNGHDFTIRREANSSRAVTFQGEVEGYHPEWVKDQWGNQHRVLKVSNTRGETWLVDLPADMSWRDLEIRHGSSFQIRGTRRSLGNQPVLAPSSFRVDGEERIQW